MRRTPLKGHSLLCLSVNYRGASIRYKKGPAIRYKKGPSIRYIGPKFRDFFLKGSCYKVHWSAESRKKNFLKKFQNFIKNVLFKLIS